MHTRTDNNDNGHRVIDADQVSTRTVLPEEAHVNTGSEDATTEAAKKRGGSR